MTIRHWLATGVLLATATTAPAQTMASPRFYTRPGSTVPFSPVVRAGDLLFVSGQIGVTEDGKVPPAVDDQAKLAMDHVRDALALAGAGMDDVVRCTAMLTDMSRWAAFNRVYAGYFRPGHLPARSAMGVTALAFGASLEVECTAYKPAR